ncbi:hypothetical protein [Streptomyces buecherae]|uniref:hypothetical protein n=1 Tax=Streptomyces buecherae TaxID=2763006 RepID=UPI001C271F17|nr:hypothetical protein [Streptomyces buecherae]
MRKAFRRGGHGAAAVALAAALTAGAAGTAGAADADRTPRHGAPDGARTAGLQGPVVTHPESRPYEYPAGEVCPFRARAEFPVSDLRLRTWTDGAGRPVFAVEDGPLVLRATNLDTGKTVEREVSGTATITYPAYPRSDVYVMSGDNWATGFHAHDQPAGRWLVSRGYMSVRISPADEGTAGTAKKLLALYGPYEDLCATLATP